MHDFQRSSFFFPPLSFFDGSAGTTHPLPCVSFSPSLGVRPEVCRVSWHHTACTQMMCNLCLPVVTPCFLPFGVLVFFTGSPRCFLCFLWDFHGCLVCKKPVPLARLGRLCCPNKVVVQSPPPQRNVFVLPLNNPLWFASELCPIFLIWSHSRCPVCPPLPRLWSDPPLRSFPITAKSHLLPFFGYTPLPRTDFHPFPDGFFPYEIGLVDWWVFLSCHHAGEIPVCSWWPTFFFPFLSRSCGQSKTSSRSPPTVLPDSHFQKTTNLDFFTPSRFSQPLRCLDYSSFFPVIPVFFLKNYEIPCNICFPWFWVFPKCPLVIFFFLCFIMGSQIMERSTYSSGPPFPF